jgi:hypothetical protein
VINGPLSQVTKPKIKNSKPMIIIGPKLVRAAGAAVIVAAIDDSPRVRDLLDLLVSICSFVPLSTGVR